MFFSDLVKQLAKDATPTIVNDELELMKRVVAEHHDWLETPEGRQGLVIELFRQLSLLDFEIMYNSPGWRTYIALHATFMSLADGALRDQVQTALAESEQAHKARIARAWQQLTTSTATGFGQSSERRSRAGHAARATMRGLISWHSRRQASPGTEWRERRVARTNGPPAIGLASIASALLEPDNEIDWDEDRLASVIRALRTWAPPDA